MIINLRLEKILKILLDTNKVVTGEQLCTTVGVSSRTIRSDVKELNYILESQGAVIISEKGKGYFLKINNSKNFDEFLNIMDEKKNNINLTAEGRAEYIIMKLLLNDMEDIEGITQIDLADELFVSLSSLKNDIKLSKATLEEKNIKIEKSSNKGIKISGSEECIRSSINQNLYSNNKFLYNHFKKLFIEKTKLEDYSLIKEIIKENITRYNLRLTDIAFQNLFTRIIIMIVRCIDSKNVSYSSKILKEFNKEPKMKIAKSICEDIENVININLNEEEICYITKYIIGSSLIASDKESIKCSVHILEENNEKLTKEILSEINKKFNVDLTEDKILIDFLGTHLKASINRAKYKINIENNMLGIIKNKYPFSFELGVLANEIIRREANVTLSENDIGFLALHFAASLEIIKEINKNTIKKAIIVCTTGVGTSLLLKVKLEAKFKGRLIISDTIPWYEFKDDFLENVDFIITTVPLNIESNKVIHIKNLLDKDEVSLIEDKLDSTSLKENSLISKFKKNLFFKNVDINDRYELLEFMTEFLMTNNYINKEIQNEIFKREALASTEIGNLVAIPHTMHEDIKESFIAVTILKKGIQWNKENVQVVLLICMAKKDQHQWKSNLERLYKSIIDIDIVLEIIKSNNFSEFIKIINKF
ncbi:transcriptional regulator LicR [Clostridium carnis]